MDSFITLIWWIISIESIIDCWICCWCVKYSNFINYCEIIQELLLLCHFLFYFFKKLEYRNKENINNSCDLYGSKTLRRIFYFFLNSHGCFYKDERKLIEKYLENLFFYKRFIPIPILFYVWACLSYHLIWVPMQSGDSQKNSLKQKLNRKTRSTNASSHYCMRFLCTYPDIKAEWDPLGEES